MDREKLVQKGDEFEIQIYLLLQKLYPDGEVYNKISFYSHPLERDTEIDILFIHPKGIFVIEAKNWSGYIKGLYDQTNWVGKGNQPQLLSVFNVFTQNQFHERAMKNYFRRKGLGTVKTNNLIVVPDGTKIISNCENIIPIGLLSHKITSIVETSTVTVNVKALAKVIEEIQ